MEFVPRRVPLQTELGTEIFRSNVAQAGENVAPCFNDPLTSGQSSDAWPVAYRGRERHGLRNRTCETWDRMMEVMTVLMDVGGGLKPRSSGDWPRFWKATFTPGADSGP